MTNMQNAREAGPAAGTEDSVVHDGREARLEDLSRLHFITLPHAEQLAAVRRLANAGMSDYGISAATGWAVEMVRRALEPEQRAAPGENARLNEERL